jgi:hypothetical protein
MVIISIGWSSLVESPDDNVGKQPTYRIAHYEGDTLVVDTIGLNDKTFIDDDAAITTLIEAGETRLQVTMPSLTYCPKRAENPFPPKAAASSKISSRILGRFTLVYFLSLFC